MLKFLVLGVILSQAVVKNCYGLPSSSLSDSQPDIVVQPVNLSENDTRDALILHQKTGQYHIYASRLNLLLGSSRNSFSAKVPTGFASENAENNLDADYVVTEGIGAHKLHIRAVSWGKARRICVDEGGHLAVIRSELEENILLSMMTKKSIQLAWVGYHDIFEEGDWFTVTDEPMAETGWARWSTEFTKNPIPNNGNCAELKPKGGLVNQKCGEQRSFICKASID